MKKTNDPFKILNSIQDREVLKQIYKDFEKFASPKNSLALINEWEKQSNSSEEDIQILKRIYSTANEYASGDGKDKWPNYPAAINEFLYLDRKMYGIMFDRINTKSLMKIIQRHLPSEE